MITNKITKIPRTSPKNTSETVKSGTENMGFDREMPKERRRCPTKGQQTIDNLRLN